MFSQKKTKKKQPDVSLPLVHDCLCPSILFAIRYSTIILMWDKIQVSRDAALIISPEGRCQRHRQLLRPYSHSLGFYNLQIVGWTQEVEPSSGVLQHVGASSRRRPATYCPSGGMASLDFPASAKLKLAAMSAPQTAGISVPGLRAPFPCCWCQWAICANVATSCWCQEKCQRRPQSPGSHGCLYIPDFESRLVLFF